MNNRKPKIFLSYRRKESLDLANRVEEALIRRSYTVFLDQKNMRTGRFDEQLLDAIKTHDFFVVILTTDTFCGRDSAKDWVLEEINTALESKPTNRIIPLIDDRIDFNDIETPASYKETFDRLGQIQSLKISNEYFDASMEKLSQLINEEYSARKISKPTLTIIGGLVLLGISGLVIISHFSKPATATQPGAQAVQTEMNPSTAEGMYQKGRIARYGLNGTQVNLSEAANWYKAAADAGHPTALAELGWLFKRGLGGLPKDSQRALILMQKSADMKDGTGLAYLGALYQQGIYIPKNEVQAVTLFQESAKMGNAYGQAYLGYMQEQGRGNLAKDMSQAIKNYRKSADQGNPQGQFNLAEIYCQNAENDVILPRNENLAKELYLKSANQGNVRAQYEIGKNYRYATCGFEKDLTKALEYFNKASDQKFGPALTQIGLIYKDQKLTKAIKYFQSAENEYDLEGMKELEKIYESGWMGIPATPEAAVKLNEKIKSMERIQPTQYSSEELND